MWIVTGLAVAGSAISVAGTAVTVGATTVLKWTGEWATVVVAATW